MLKESLNILSHGTTGLCTWQVKINDYVKYNNDNKTTIITRSTQRAQTSAERQHNRIAE